MTPFEKINLEIKKVSMLIAEVRNTTNISLSKEEESKGNLTFIERYRGVIRAVSDDAAQVLFEILKEIKDVEMTFTGKTIFVECDLTAKEFSCFSGDKHLYQAFYDAVKYGTMELEEEEEKV